MRLQRRSFSTGGESFWIGRGSSNTNSASGLNLVVAAIILWNTVYLNQATQHWHTGSTRKRTVSEFP
jgi:TnpA family transposase